ncbi:MAG TPA: hypothetical protein VEO54_03170 [Thermoanaerobaculia bacterium]|nr:hypothetical protein [Thermoanaerobaculia bacterium]
MKMRLCLFLVLMAAAAAPSFGQYRLRELEDTPSVEPWAGEVSYASGQYLDNPCTAIQDWVWVEYTADVLGNEADPNIARYIFNESTSMGGMYQAAGSSVADVAYSSPVTTRHYHKVNTSDNFHVVTVVNWDPATKQMTLAVETACGNGMPDSAQ